jgi:transcription elongation factor GreA
MSVAAGAVGRDGAGTPFGDAERPRYRGVAGAGTVCETSRSVDMNEGLITPEGLARVQAELERLRTEGRRQVAELLRQAAAAEADTLESADYRAAREEKTRLEMRIAQLEARLASIEVAEPDGANGVLDLGERVRLRNLETGARVEYEVVGSLEADLGAGQISAASPVGRAVLGRRRGEIAVVDAPVGRVRFKILSIAPSER